MNKIKLLRKEKGYTLEKLASQLGVSANALSMYENEKREASYQTLRQLAQIFNVSIDYLLGFDEKEKSLIEPEHAKTIWLNTLSDIQKRIIEYVLKLNELNQYKTMTYLYALCEN